ncbi:MAG: lysylphosphatidylglycerol synthase transmembrane domain-containing protein [Vicinamibacteria bacterium]
MQARTRIGVTRPSFASRAAGTVIILIGAVWTLHDVAWRALWSHITAAAPGWVALAALTNMVVVLLQTLRWLSLVRPLSPRIRFIEAFDSLIVCLAVSTVIPARAGEIVRVRSLSRKTGLPLASVIATIGLDYVVNAVTLALGVVLLLFFIDLPAWMHARRLAAVLVVGGAVLAALSFSTRSARGVPRTGFLATLRHGLGAASQPRALALSITASMAMWILEIFMTSFSMRAVGIDLPLSSACLVLLGVNLALAIPFQPPGNFGLVEVGAAVTLGGLGVGKEEALAFGIVYHLLQVVPIVVVGAAFWAGGRNLAAATPDGVGAMDTNGALTQIRLTQDRPPER